MLCNLSCRISSQIRFHSQVLFLDYLGPTVQPYELRYCCFLEDNEQFYTISIQCVFILRADENRTTQDSCCTHLK